MIVDQLKQCIIDDFQRETFGMSREDILECIDGITKRLGEIRDKIAKQEPLEQP